MNKIKLLPLLFLAGFLLWAAPAKADQLIGSPIVQDPSALTTRVNKKISIANYAPTDLVSLGALTGGSGQYLRQVAYNDLKAMFDDAAVANLPLKVTSAYRSFSEQQQLYTNGTSGDPNGSDVIAKPGYSEHQLGLALDIGAANTLSGFGSTPQSAWLQSNAYKYGFALSYPSGKESITGYTYEPWHYRYIGRSEAAAWKQSGLVLEQYLALKPQLYLTLSLTGQVIKLQNDPTVYIVNSNGTKRGFINAAAFLSYGYQWGDILLVPQDQLAGLPETKVVKLQGDPTVYQFNPDKTRQAIASESAYLQLGYKWSDIVEINATELAGYQVGPIIK